MIKVVYILGMGHSGSTLLSKILGGNKQCISLGQVRHWSDGINNPEIFNKEATGSCTCGEKIKDCAFFKEITNDFQLDFRISSHFSKTEYISIIKYFLHIIDLSKIQLDSDDYIKFLSKVYKTLNVQYIVDSSKTLINLLKLNQSKDMRVFVIHLIRDIRGYGNSYNKLKYYNFYSSLLYWIMFNKLYKKYLKESNLDYITIGYDNFAKNPESYLNKIGDWLGLNFSKYIDDVNNASYHELPGNEMRFKTFKGIKYDESWITQLPLLKKFLTSLIGFFFNKKWVYQDSFNHPT